MKSRGTEGEISYSNTPTVAYRMRNKMENNERRKRKAWSRPPTRLPWTIWSSPTIYTDYMMSLFFSTFTPSEPSSHSQVSCSTQTEPYCSSISIIWFRIMTAKYLIKETQGSIQYEVLKESLRVRLMDQTRNI